MTNRKIELKRLFKNAIFVRLLAVGLIALAFFSANHNFLALKNVRNLLSDIVPYFTMGMGVTFAHCGI